MKVSNKMPITLFILASSMDFGTTLYGVGRGFSEANPALAKVVTNTSLFALTYVSYTLIGLILLWFILRMAQIFPVFRPFAMVFVFLKTLPAVNNVLLLTGFSHNSIAFTTVRWLLSIV